jgi:DNA-directed RNA polymerase subunit omega
MIEPRIDELLSHTPTDGDPASRYALVIVSAKRARQINNYPHQLGEGMGLEDAPPPLVESRSKNYLTMAMEEIARGKLTFSYGAPQAQ